MVRCCYIVALVLIYFRITKGHATFFQPETIVESFMHLVVLLYKIIIDQFYSNGFKILISGFDNIAPKEKFFESLFLNFFSIWIHFFFFFTFSYSKKVLFQGQNFEIIIFMDLLVLRPAESENLIFNNLSVCARLCLLSALLQSKSWRKLQI